MSLAENTTILFSEVLFMLPLSIFFLGEKLKLKSSLAALIGFVGLLVMFRPETEKLNYMALVPTGAALIFAVSNIIIKKMVEAEENTLTMLFYFGLHTTIVSGVFVPLVWLRPNMNELFLLLMLGVGANLIQFFIFLAYRAASALIINPVRYIELPFAIFFGFIFFEQLPGLYDLVGSALIIIGTFLASTV
jgi:S-adenosylmethionine uptake transporter